MAELRYRQIATFSSVQAIEEDASTLGINSSVVTDSTAWRVRWRLYLVILAYRLVNALLVHTFQVPDETWQSLEVAHHLVFGPGFLTWEWRHGLRSIFHPLLFAGVYKLLQWSRWDQSGWLVYSPQVLCGCIAALVDIFTFRFSYRLFGPTISRWTLLVSLVSWTMGTSIVRPLANSVETLAVSAALFYWPCVHSWRWSSFVYALVWAGLGGLLRPTSALVWIVAGIQLLWSLYRKRGPWKTVAVLATGMVLCVVGLLVCVDRYFYGQWILTPYNFYHFNVSRNLSTWFGVEPWYWYLIVATPSLLATLLPWFGYGLWCCIREPDTRKFQPWLWVLGLVTLGYSLLQHKETRFLSCLLPLAFTITAVGLAYFTDPGHCLHKGRFLISRDMANQPTRPWYRRVGFTVAFLVLTNIPATLYINLVHQRGVVDVTHYLRHLAQSQNHVLTSDAQSSPMSHVVFLMPCHSTPYYSHVHYDVPMSFLSCEPPLDPQQPVSTYHYDSGDFGDDPAKFLATYMAQVNQQVQGSAQVEDFGHNSLKITPLPSHWVLFAVVLPQVQPFLESHGYKECQRFFNTHWNGDHRRRGDVVVYCRHFIDQ
ncbi:glycosylphosphatidylinositol anchor biosynthesis [Dispira simplex]|nr:glycosylphosphatidylinositol anchor biosynthesis [Dispira simplex]